MLISIMLIIITDRAPFQSHTNTLAFPQCCFPSGITVLFSYSINNGRIGHKSAGVCVQDSISWLFVWKENKPSGFIRRSVNNSMDPPDYTWPSDYIHRVGPGVSSVFQGRRGLVFPLNTYC